MSQAAASYLVSTHSPQISSDLLLIDIFTPHTETHRGQVRENPPDGGGGSETRPGHGAPDRSLAEIRLPQWTAGEKVAQGQ